MDTTIVCCSHTIQDGTLNALISKTEEDIKAIPQLQGKWRYFSYMKNDPGAQEISVENGPLSDGWKFKRI